MRLILVIVLVCSGLYVQAQFNVASNLRKKKIATNGVIKLDSLSLVPHSVFIPSLDTSFYFVDDIKSILIWKRQLRSDSVEVSYRIFPFQFDAEAKRYNYDSLKTIIAQGKPVIVKKFNSSASDGKFFDFGNVNYNGSFGRSISFGNSQDAVFNSQLNLQLSGVIGDSIQIAAAITDNNIPIQPDGTTQQLNEFDRVWLQFKKKGWELNLGDIDIRQNQNYFLNFYKRLQGISFQNIARISKNSTNKTLVSGAIAKGKFTRNIFNGLEGNQGPYKLIGANNETYFVILAGTERVFIDGELMQRGEDADYVINYNTAEVTFTPKRMITKDKRIQVEFEYADRSYLNSMLYLADELQVNKKLKINIAAYSNSDAKNSQINQTLDTRQKQFLADIGDNIKQALYPVAEVDTFSVSKILYLKRYTSSGLDSFYVYSTNPDSAKYNLSFTDVGIGNGNYNPLYSNTNAANGKVYQYIEPINGVRQGQYEPAALLITPKKQQLVSIGADYKINEKTYLKTEMALSNYDVNTFSSKDKNNNTGYAGKFSLNRDDKLKFGKNKMLLNSMVGYEWVDQRFNPLERLRNVEFSRDFGLDLSTVKATEHLPSASVGVRDYNNNILQYSFLGYLRSDRYNGFRNTLQYDHNLQGLQLRNLVSYTNVTTPSNKGFFFRPTVDISKQFKNLRNYTLGVNYALEQNEQRYISTDTLTPLSFSNETITAYIRSNAAKANKWGFNYFTRSNKLPVSKSMIETDRSHNYNFNAELLKSSKHQFRFNVTYRQLFVKNDKITTLTSENSLLGRAEYVVNEWKGFLTGSALYEIGSGQEQKRDYSYIEVQAGRGEYAWNDYNNDGIPQINEFELALFPDQAKYIRVFTPSNVYIKANYTQFNYSVTLNPRALMSVLKNKKFSNFIARFMLQSSLQTAKKKLSDGGPEFDPFSGKITDTSLISLNNIFSNTISFNRTNSYWGLDISNVVSNNKALLTYGFESRKTTDWSFRARANLTGKITVEVVQRIGNNDLTTPSFDNRNYQLNILSTEPKVIFTSSTKYRLQASYQFGSKENTPLYGGEKTSNKSLNLEGKLNGVQSFSLNLKFTYNKIDFTGTTGTTTSYIMLDGLLPGKNLLWNIELTKRIMGNFELSFQYDGRRPEGSRTINIGRASLRALL